MHLNKMNIYYNKKFKIQKSHLMKMSSYEISLFGVLKKKNNTLASRLDNIREIARKLLVYTQSKFPYYTPHGFTHSENVETCLNWLIYDDLKEKFEPIEIFLLILGAWFHDWGMIGAEDEDPETIRETHHLRTEKFINENYEKIRISKEEAVILGKLCRAHRMSEDLNSSYYDVMSIGQGINVDTRYLSALIRISDEFDITANRVPEIIYFHLNPSSKAAVEFEKHLQVIGIAYASENKKYKINISAITRNPKGAEVMENLKEKLQNTLNSVKSILARKKIIIDIVDLNLTCQGFIHKPIKFELNNKKIVDLLIGEHLYKKETTSIRELIQNSIDACRSKKIIYPEFPCKITLLKPNKHTLIIEDNGLGMDFKIAKKFLSCIGESFYNSEEFKKKLQKNQISPISKFGIGILSSFLISDSIVIETKKDFEEPCRFQIDSSDETWKYGKGALRDSGTKITLNLKEKFSDIDLETIIKSYIVTSEIPIHFENKNGIIEKFETRWSVARVEEFLEIISLQFPKGETKEVWRFENDELKIIIGKSSTLFKTFVLFNQGIFVRAFNFPMNCLIGIDLKKDLVDLEISREDIIINSKWNSFLELLYNTIYDELKNQYIPSDIDKYCEVVGKILSQKIRFSLLDLDEITTFVNKQNKFTSFYLKGCYPIYKNGIFLWESIENILKYKEIILVQTSDKNFVMEREILKNILDKDKIYFFNLWRLRYDVKNQSGTFFIDPFSFHKKEHIIVKRVNIFDILIKNLQIFHHPLEEFTPDNIKFARFPSYVNPIVLVEKSFIFNVKNKFKIENISGFLRFSLSVKDIIDENRFNQVYEILEKDIKEIIDSIEIYSYPEVIINSDDEFIKNILSNKEDILANQVIISKFLKYLKLLMWLPFIVRTITYDYFYLELIDNYEIELSKALKMKTPDTLVKRWGKLRNSMLDYYQNLKKYEEIIEIE